MLLALLQAATEETAKGSPVRRYFWAAVALVGLGLLTILIAGWMFARWRREARSGVLARRRQRRNRVRDPWVEAGRRARAPTPEELEGERGPVDER